jgi:ribosomal protein S18 acetylase RimI-like enzyme
MAAHIDERYNPDIQAAELAHPGSTFFIAYIGSEAVGFARVREDEHPTAVSSGRALEVHRFYVLRQHWGSGVGRALMAACIDEARARGVDVMWLAAWSENPRAVGFYRSHGFVEVGSQPYVLGDEVHLDFIFELRLDPPEKP